MWDIQTLELHFRIMPRNKEKGEHHKAGLPETHEVKTHFLHSPTGCLPVVTQFDSDFFFMSNSALTMVRTCTVHVFNKCFVLGYATHQTSLVSHLCFHAHFRICSSTFTSLSLSSFVCPNRTLLITHIRFPPKYRKDSFIPRALILHASS